MCTGDLSSCDWLHNQSQGTGSLLKSVGSSVTLLALNCRGNPAAVPGPGLFSSAPESRALQCWFGVGTPDQGASLCNSLALHTGEVHMPVSGLSCSGLV